MKPILATLLAALALAGCAASQPTRYYTLASPESSGSSHSSAMPVDGQPLAIELAPLALPERLARPQIVMRQAGPGGEAQLTVLEQHRWASSFENELRDALASGIAMRLGALDQSRSARANTPATYRIAVHLRQFDAVDAGRVDAAFSWTLRHVGDPQAQVHQLALSEPVAGDSVDALAQAAQRLVARMAEAISGSVTAAQGLRAGAKPS